MSIGRSLTLIFSLSLITAIASGASSCDPTSTESSNSGATEVRFEVWGYAANGADITYGGSGTNLDGKLPLDVTLTIDSNESYYNVSAQLQGGGDIRCSVTIGDQIRDGHARGGYNICSAQLNHLSGGWR